MKILITGGTGLVGKKLTSKLLEKGHEVNILVRGEVKNPNEFHWDYQAKELDEAAFQDAECLIHLAGANIGKRWTKSYKEEILRSRVDSAVFLLQKLQTLHHHLKSYISASGINYYGTFTSEKILDENSGILHHDFLSEVCRLWEKAGEKFSSISDRVIFVRTAPALSKKGGTFEPLKRIAEFNLSTPIGSGKQWFNWIHIDDLVNIYVKAVEDQNMAGTYNAVANEIPTQEDFMRELSTVLNKAYLPFAIPKILPEIALGEMSEILLEGTRCSNRKLKNQGFEFTFPTLNTALKDLLK